VDSFEGLANAPGKGHKRPDLTSSNVLFFSVYQYMIVYRRAAMVEIVAVLHGKRDDKAAPPNQGVTMTLAKSTRGRQVRFRLAVRTTNPT
jgi:hypothetical protein